TKQLKNAPETFGLLADLRNMKTLPAESRDILENGQQLFRDRGMARSVVIFEDSITAVQFKRIAKNTGIYDSERYIDAQLHHDWNDQGEVWIVEGKEPA
ncbi:MAG: hypothetical protein WBA74_22220, partial [Cyclobacteriaceae bacterium]